MRIFSSASGGVRVDVEAGDDPGVHDAQAVLRQIEPERHGVERPPLLGRQRLGDALVLGAEAERPPSRPESSFCSWLPRDDRGPERQGARERPVRIRAAHDDVSHQHEPIGRGTKCVAARSASSSSGQP